MGVNRKNIQNMLKRQDLSFNQMIKKLNVTEEYTNEEVENYIFEVLYSDIISMPKKVSVDRIKHIYVLLKYLNQGAEYLDYNEKNQAKMARLLNYIKAKTNSNINKTVRELLNDVENNLVLIKVQHEGPTVNLDSEAHSKTSRYVEYLTFEVKKFEYVYSMISSDLIKLSQAPNFRKSYTSKVFSKYIEAIEQNNYYDMFYYDKLIRVFLKNKYLLDDDVRVYFFRELKELLNLDLDERRQTFLISTINRMCGVKLTDPKDALNEINVKYLADDNIDDATINQVDDDDYVDMTSKKVITIDGAGTYSYDDALSIERLANGNVRLGIYITNVADFINKASRLDIAALNKGASIYVPFNRVPMFPDYLSNHVFSLIEHEKKYAIAHMFEFDSKTLELVGFNIERAIINVKHNYSFEEADKVLKNPNHEDYNTFKDLYVLSQNLNINRQNIEAYHSMKNVVRQVNFDRDLISKDYSSGVSSNMNSEYMIYLNSFIAELFNNSKYNLPFLYRNNTSDMTYGNALRKEFEETKEIEKIKKEIKKVYQQSSYSVENIGHQGLNMPAYGHLGSPIRNYASLVAQRLEIEFLIKKNIADNIISGWNSDLEYIADVLNKRIEINDQYVYEYNKLYKTYKSALDMGTTPHKKR